MIGVYPVALIPSKNGYLVEIPDFNINAFGKDTAEALYMTRDAIGVVGIDMEDDGETLPEASNMEDIAKQYPDGIISLVDIDFAEYRRKNDMRTVRRNVSLPSWLNERAEAEGLNVSAVLQDALIDKVGAR